MGIWIIGFELFCVTFYVLLVYIIVKRKDYIRVFEMFTGTIFGILLEIANILVFENYVYSTEFLLEVGIYPWNVPVSIGLAWGMLVYCSMDISDRYDISMFSKILMDAVICVTFDLALDVLAIRLEGGLWIWLDHKVNTEITSSTLFGVTWSNFLGWFNVILVISFILRIKRKKLKDISYKIEVILVFIIPIFCAIILIILIMGPAAILIFLFPWLPLSSMAGFLGSYFISIAIIMTEFILKKPDVNKTNSIITLTFFSLFYSLTYIGMIVIGLSLEIPIYFIMCIFFLIATLYIDVHSTNFEKSIIKTNKNMIMINNYLSKKLRLK